MSCIRRANANSKPAAAIRLEGLGQLQLERLVRRLFFDNDAIVVQHLDRLNRRDGFHFDIGLELRRRGQPDLAAGLFTVQREKYQRTASDEGAPGAEIGDPFAVIELRAGIHVHAVRPDNVAAINVREGVFPRRRNHFTNRSFSQALEKRFALSSE